MMSQQLTDQAPSRTSSFKLPANALPNCIFLLALFPNINVFPFLSVNNQPVAFLIVAVWWLLTTNWNVPLNRIVIFFYSLVCLSAVYGLLTWLYSFGSNPFSAHATGFANYPASIFQLVVTYISYLVGPTIFLYLLYNFRRIDTWPVKFFISFQLLICTAQMFGSGAVQAALDGVFGSFFIGFLQESHEFGRGVAGTYPEPSHLGRYLLVMMGLLFVFREQCRLTGPQFAGYALALAALIVLNQSLTALAIFMLWLLLQFFRAILAGNVFRGIAVLASIALAVVLVDMLPDSTRMGEASNKVLSMLAVISDLRFLDLQIIGGIRLVNMAIGYSSVSLFPFGQGLGSYLHNLPETAAMLGVNIQDTSFYRNVVAEVGAENIITKPNGFGAQLAYDFGYLGLLLMLTLTVSVIHAAIRNLSDNKAIWGLPIVGLILVLFYTTTTFPVPWILLAFLAFYRTQPWAPKVSRVAINKPADGHAIKGAQYDSG